eukprot:RCo024190
MHAHLFDQTDEVPSGVFNQKTLKPLSLLGAGVTVLVQQYAARVTVVQHYRNLEPAAATAAFVFPLDDDWVVHDFRAELDDRSLNINVKERDRRLKEYRDSAFVASLGEITPGALVQIKITFVMNVTHLSPSLDQSKPVVNLHLRRSILPTPSAPYAGLSEWANGFVVALRKKLHHGIILDVNCQMEYPITDVHCNYGTREFHSRYGKWYKYELDTGAAVTVAGGVPTKPPGTSKTLRARMDFEFASNEAVQLFEDLDFTLELDEPSSVMKLSSIHEKSQVSDAEMYAFQWVIAPTFTEEQVAAPNTELLLLIDCSGSMTPYMSELQRAAALCLQSLPTSVRFNVALYGESCKLLSDSGALAMTQDNLLRAREFVRAAEATMGDTNLLKALKATTSAPVTRGYCRQILLVTDGGMIAPHDTVKAAKELSSCTRVFPFLLNPRSAELEVMQQLASSCGGRATNVVSSGGSLAEILLATLEDMLQPALTQPLLSYAYEGSALKADPDEIVPPIRNTAALPPLFRGSSYTLAAFGGSDLQANAVATLSSWVGEQRLEWTYHMGDPQGYTANDRGTVGSYSVLHTVAAASRIRELTEFNPRSCPTPAEAQEVTGLSSTFTVISPLTCFVCSAAAKDSAAQARTWSKDHLATSEIACEFSYVLPRSERDVGRVVRPRPPLVVDPPSESLRRGPPPDRRFKPTPPPPTTTTEFMQGIVLSLVDAVCQPPRVEDLLFLQSAEGSWSMDARLARLFGLPLDHLLHLVPEVPKDLRLEIPAILERDRRLEEERCRAEELAELERQKEAEKLAQKAAQEAERERKLQAARARMSEDELAAYDAAQKKKQQEAAEKAKLDHERAEKERKEREKEAERQRKKLEADRKKLIKKLGEDAVRAQEEEELRRAAEKQEKLRLQAEAVIQRQNDARALWEAEQRQKFLDDIWATALALAYLKLAFEEAAPLYQLLARRAARWLCGVGVAE